MCGCEQRRAKARGRRSSGMQHRGQVTDDNKAITVMISRRAGGEMATSRAGREMGWVVVVVVVVMVVVVVVVMVVVVRPAV